MTNLETIDFSGNSIWSSAGNFDEITKIIEKQNKIKSIFLRGLGGSYAQGFEIVEAVL